LRVASLLAGVVISTSVAILWACNTKDEPNPPATGCGSQATIAGVAAAVGSASITPAPGTEAGGSVASAPGINAAGFVTITGSIANAPCGVHGVTVAGAIAATATLPNYASWAAVVPLDLLESQGGPCTPGITPPDAGDAGSGGVQVTVQALVASDPGQPDLPLAMPFCVSLTQPELPAACGASLTCVAPPDEAGPSGVQCQIPQIPGAPASFALFTDTNGIGRQVTWKSSGGLLSFESPLAVVQAADGGPAACDASGCGVCAGEDFTTAIGISGASAGVDQIVGILDGYQDPVAIFPVAVQGPAKLSLSTSSLAGYAATLLAVSNPMAFWQNCTFAVPPGVEVFGVSGVDAGQPGDNACAIPDATASGGPCTFPFQSTARTQIYEVLFRADVSTSTIPALGPARPVNVVCVDSFGQVALTSFTAAWTSAPDAGTTGGGGDASADGAAADAGGPG
ncbi:MAG TPA: hypothetical protein VK841_26860, partial [Polyangiaceae bacterium]|nr:hypothetical protein [Polyangiaceae bacterium]